jgi:microcystin-dependent protein
MTRVGASEFTTMDPFFGEIKIVSYGYAPRGWAFCDGARLPIAQNAALFSLIGTAYGGNEVSYFKLPDLQDRVPLGFGEGPGLTYRPLGRSGGASTVTLGMDQLPQHRHDLPVSSAGATTDSPVSGVVAASNSVSAVGAGSDKTLVTMAPDMIAPAGSGEPHMNLPPVFGLSFVIALSGIYPYFP